MQYAQHHYLEKVPKNKIREKNGIKPNVQGVLYIMHKITIKMIKNFCYFDEPKNAIIFKKLLQFTLKYVILYSEVRG
jgi:hypothetical protein